MEVGHRCEHIRLERVPNVVLIHLGSFQTDIFSRDVIPGADVDVRGHVH